MKPLIILSLSLWVPFLNGGEKWDVTEVAEHGFIFKSKDYGAHYSFYYTGIVDAGITGGDATIHPRYTWRITDSGLLVIKRGQETLSTFRKVRVSGNGYQVEENGYPKEYRRTPLDATKSANELSWKPDPKDVEEFRQALMQLIPPGYKVSPYAELGEHKGFAVYYDASEAPPKLSTDPQIWIMLCPKLAVDRRRQLQVAWEAAIREYRGLSKEERRTKWGDSWPRAPELPKAYFRSLGISELPPKPDDMASCYQVKLTPEEKRNFQLIDGAILKLITVYQQAPIEAPEPAGKTN